MRLKVTIDGGVDSIGVSINARSAAIVQNVANKMTYLMLRLQQKIVGEKLSGQMLNRVTGTLANSVVAVPAQVEGTTVTGEVLAAGGPAWYGVVHIRGGQAPYQIVPVDKKALRFLLEGGTKFSMRNLRQPLPKRDFMGAALSEMREEIIRGLAEATLGVG